VLRINGDLERLADLARHIAKRIKKLATDPHAFPIPQPLENLGLEALSQVQNSLDALTGADVDQAKAVMAAEKRVDRHYRSVLKLLKHDIVAEPQRINTWLRLVNTARNIERIADHAAKIAEAVVYLREGEILRHRATGGQNPGPAPSQSRFSP
jgi:phosphate transport system protein